RWTGASPEPSRFASNDTSKTGHRMAFSPSGDPEPGSSTSRWLHMQHSRWCSWHPVRLQVVAARVRVRRERPFRGFALVRKYAAESSRSMGLQLARLQALANAQAHGSKRTDRRARFIGGHPHWQGRPVRGLRSLNLESERV